MTVTLTPEQEKFVAEQLERGHYQSVADIIAQGLGILRAQEDFISANTTELREKIAIGRQQIERGEFVDGREGIRKLREKLKRRETDAE